jgi:hypothetical protein
MYCWSGHNSVGLKGVNRKDRVANPTRFFHLCLSHHYLLLFSALVVSLYRLHGIKRNAVCGSRMFKAAAMYLPGSGRE